MNKGQQIGLGINFLGLILFVVWFIVRNRISTTFSIIFAVIFLGLLVVSLFVMIRATKLAAKDNSAKQVDRKV